jgi:hypothetical protein
MAGISARFRWKSPVLAGFPHQPKPAVNLPIDAGGLILDNVTGSANFKNSGAVLRCNLDEAVGFNPLTPVLPEQ